MFKGFQDKGFSGIKACFFSAKRTFWVKGLKIVHTFGTADTGFITPPNLPLRQGGEYPSLLI